MRILGLSCFKCDSAACLVCDGQIVAAGEEERFSRIKHDSAFPAHAIAYVLASAGLTGADLDAVVFYEKPQSSDDRHSVAPLSEMIAQACGYKGEVTFCDHHGSHAASAFFTSSFRESAVLIVDGEGEGVTTALYHGKGETLTPLYALDYPHSLGLFYAAMTAYLGFEVNEGEYKVMGLAAYGAPTCLDELRKLIAVHEDGSFALDMSYFAFTQGKAEMFTPKLIELLGPARQPDGPMPQRYMDIAASTQKLMEEVMLGLARAAQKMTGAENLCLAGGVAHNVVANARLKTSGIFENIHIPFSAGDNGGAIGAALYGHQILSGQPRTMTPALPYLGPAYDDAAIEVALSAQPCCTFRRMDSEALLTHVATLLHQQAVIGWFQGHMEFGPRALGNRSILASPCDAAMKDTLNARVKRREEFRPFAPAILAERANEYFIMEGESPAMLFAAAVRPEKRAVIPAVTHVDGSARAQTVRREDNPLFYDLIAAFEKISGVPVLINTSFNIRGEPIVCTPDDAINCFLGTDIDALVLGSFFVTKLRSGSAL